MDGSLRGDWDEGPQDSKKQRWEVEEGGRGVGQATKPMLRRKKGTLRNALVSLWSELLWKTARNRSSFVEKTVKTLQDEKNGMLICLPSLLLQLQIFPLTHKIFTRFFKVTSSRKAAGSQNVSLVGRSVDGQLEGVAGHVGVSPVPQQQLHAVQVSRPSRVVQDRVSVAGPGVHVATLWNRARLQRGVTAAGVSSRWCW